MSQITMTQCEACKNRVEDSYAIPGWIRLSQFNSISISRGRGSDGSAKSTYQGRGGFDVDFCSRKCFLAWFDKIAAQKNPVEK